MAEESNSKGSLATLTPREQEVLIAGIRNAKSGEIQVDYEALATALGLKNSATARTAWCSVKKKAFGNIPSADSPADGATPKKTPKKPAAAKKTAETPAPDAANVEVNESEDVPATPATPKTPTATPKKRGRKTKAEKEAEAAANGETPAAVEDEEGEKPAKKRRTPAKKKTAAAAEGDGDEAEVKPATPAKAKRTPASRKGSAAATGANKTPVALKKEEEGTDNDIPAGATAPTANGSAAKIKKEEEASAAAEANDVLLSKKVVTPNLPAPSSDGAIPLADTKTKTESDAEGTKASSNADEDEEGEDEEDASDGADA